MPNKLCYGWNEVVMGILLWQTAITSIKHHRVHGKEGKQRKKVVESACSETKGILLFPS